MYRKRVYRKKKLGRKVRRKVAHGKRTYRAKRRNVFSETFKASALIVNQDASGATPAQAQSLEASINSIQQFSSYKNLYKKYRILKLEWTFLPLFGSAEPNQGEANVGSGGPYDTNTWMHYRRSWDTNSTVYPATELSMLQMNGTRTLLLNGQRKPIKISMSYPTPQLTLSEASAGAHIDQTKNTWLSFDDDTQAIDHGRLYVYTVNRSEGVFSQGSVCADVYCKVTFAVCDPR